jgi:hypothetical protein
VFAAGIGMVLCPDQCFDKGAIGNNRDMVMHLDAMA